MGGVFGKVREFRRRGASFGEEMVELLSCLSSACFHEREGKGRIEPEELAEARNCANLLSSSLTADGVGKEDFRGGGNE